ncbi:MAG: hypothetical protein HYR91_12355 [Flavobacteriia bacterium]|nr:hypothetical protein [Flavobacteriia bacterium]
MIKTLFLFLGFIFCINVLFAQDFRWQATIENVQKSGFHKIVLDPRISAQVKSDFSDIRLFDKEGKEVPYVLNFESTNYLNNHFIEYPIIKRIIQPHVKTEIILQNTTKKSLNNLNLIIQNSDVQKEVKISGSDDLNNWFIIKDNYLFNSIFSNTETAEMIQMNFPLSNYNYLKIEINDRFTEPINVLKAGFYISTSAEGNYTKLQNLTFHFADSIHDKRSYVQLNLPDLQLIHKCKIQISSPALYKRNAFLANCIVDTTNGEIRRELQPLQQFELTSEGINQFVLNGISSQNLYLIIENEDNPPLEIKEIEMFQLNTYLTADLKKGDTYILKFGDKNLEAPSYDLAFFQDKIPSNIPIIRSNNVVKLQNLENSDMEIPQEEDQTVLWLVIGAVIIFIGWLSFKMLNDMKNK